MVSPVGFIPSMSIDENLNAFMNTPSKLVPLEQVSSGTMDQIYLALRLAAARLIQNEAKEQMPLVFDDSFVLYDEDRLRSALNGCPLPTPDRSSSLPATKGRHRC